MAFLQEGDIPVKVSGAMIAESTLNKKPGSFDLCVEVTNEDGTQKDWWRGNMSADYTQISNRQGQTCTQVTYENVVSLGYQGPDFSQWPGNPQVDWQAVLSALEGLFGAQTTAHCQKSRCGRYINIKWLGGSGGNTPKAVDLAALMGGVQPAQQPAQPQPQAQGGGFGGQPQPQQGGGFGGQPQQGGGFGGQPAQGGGFGG